MEYVYSISQMSIEYHREWLISLAGLPTFLYSQFETVMRACLCGYSTVTPAGVGEQGMNQIKLVHSE